ncbi:helix-turn-helix transcriptional regulator [Brevundimonas fluminis]|jgi:HTH-type transcriptional regulator / antitoxin HipB|uniref:helix-turn-helix transcriptional regulator n=1 Tax=Brevundimonas fluminis TaxID=2487274 RepID=UPI000F656E80|nr:helix-turn-helix transcriptional regulator [Brevundimonas fluminis]
MTPLALGSRVRAERKRLGLRQDQLAASAGVGLRFLVDLERGKPTVRLDKVLSVLEALGLTLDVRSSDDSAGERET